MSLTSAYARAWQTQYGLAAGWFVNTQPNDRIALGLKGQLVGDALRQSGPLAALADLAPPPTEPHDHSGWQFQSSSSVSFEAAVAAGSAAAVDWLGAADAGVKASFGREAGMMALGTHKWFRRFGDMDQVRSVLRRAVEDGELVEGDAVVVELQVTGRGLLLAAQAGGASVEVLASGTLAPSHATVADFSGSFGVARQQGAVTMEQFGDGAVIAARVMVVGHRGLWWWRRTVVLGLDPVSAQQQEARTFTPVEGDGPDEYFLLF